MTSYLADSVIYIIVEASNLIAFGELVGQVASESVFCKDLELYLYRNKSEVIFSCISV